MFKNKKKTKKTPDSVFRHVYSLMCFLRLCFQNSRPGPPSMYDVLTSRTLAFGVPSDQYLETKLSITSLNKIVPTHKLYTAS